jgi:hypothetical protein
MNTKAMMLNDELETVEIKYLKEYYLKRADLKHLVKEEFLN